MHLLTVVYDKPVTQDGRRQETVVVDHCPRPNVIVS